MVQHEVHPLPVALAASLKHSASCLRSWGDDLYWIESRPELDGARVVLRAHPGGEPEIVSPAGLSLSSDVHEYGGGALCVVDGDDGPVIVGIRAQDQAVVSFRPHDAEPAVVIAVEPGTAIGDLSWGPGATMLAVREIRHHEGIARDLVLLDLTDGVIVSLVAHRDFFSDPRVDQHGRLVWCAWDHPSMPWEGSEVWTAQLRRGEGRVEVAGTTHVAGGPSQPASNPVLLADGTLAVVIETDDKAQLWRWSGVGGLEQLSRGAGEVGQPLWVLGTTSVARIAGTDALACVYRSAGRSVAARLEDEDLVEVRGLPGSVSEVITTTSGIGILGVGDEELGFVAWQLRSGEVTRVALGPTVPGPVATAAPVEVVGEDGRVVHGLVFAPIRLDERPPPVVVFCHGGPTGQALAGLNPLIQALTSRGLCVVAANYAGSTGFGAAYRHRLDGQWGIADVADCVTLVSGLAERGLVDGERAAIRGTSAGGLTALLGLTTGAFRGAVSWYGVADLVTLAKSTHDFESHYLDRLVGPLPEALTVYEERSPVHRAGDMVGAALLLQGLEDPIVPPEQAASMAGALRANGHDVELIEFPGESHGFRRLETLVTAFAAEVAFYERHLVDADDAGSIDSQ